MRAACRTTAIIDLCSFRVGKLDKPKLTTIPGRRIAVRDLVVGEVWHASGQSNVAMTAGSMARELEPVKSDVAAADLPAIRFCRVNEAESSQPLDDLRVEASWTPCSPATVAGFSRSLTRSRFGVDVVRACQTLAPAVEQPGLDVERSGGQVHVERDAAGIWWHRRA